MSCDCQKESVVRIEEAARILDVSVPWARVLLRSPDRVVQSEMGHPMYLYCRRKVELIAQKRKCELCKKRADVGKRHCYLCRNRFYMEDLTSGICPDCQAYKWLRNFTHHGDCLFNEADYNRIETLEKALKKLKHQVLAGKAKAI